MRFVYCCLCVAACAMLFVRCCICIDICVLFFILVCVMPFAYCKIVEVRRSSLRDVCLHANMHIYIYVCVAAAALDYGLYRRQHFTDAKTVVAFVSVGHSTASVCIAAFTSSGAELLAEVSDPDLGGRDMDVLIAQHFAKIFEKQHGINPLENIKAKLKYIQNHRRPMALSTKP